MCGRAGLTRPARTFYNAVMRTWITLLALIGGLTAGSGGTSGYPYLNIPVSVDEALLGLGSGVIPGPTSLRINPAAWPTQRTAALQGISYLAGIRGLGAFYVPNQRMAFALYGWTSGSMPRTDTLGNPVGNFSTTHSAFTGYYHQPFRGKGIWGIGVSLYYQGIAEYNALALGLDLGVVYPIPDRPVTVGVSLRHLGVEVKPLAQRRSNPGPEFDVMAAWHLQNLDVTAGFGLTPNHALFTLGSLWRVNALLSVGLGFSSKGLEANVGRERDILNGFSAGFKVHHRTLTFGYAYSPLGELGDIHRISLEFARF